MFQFTVFFLLLYYTLREYYFCYSHLSRKTLLQPKKAKLFVQGYLCLFQIEFSSHNFQSELVLILSKL